MNTTARHVVRALELLRQASEQSEYRSVCQTLQEARTHLNYAQEWELGARVLRVALGMAPRGVLGAVIAELVREYGGEQ